MQDFVDVFASSMCGDERKIEAVRAFCAARGTRQVQCRSQPASAKLLSWRRLAREDNVRAAQH